MDVTTESDRLLRLLDKCPVAIVEIAADGAMRMMNALAKELLLPINGGAPIDNLFDFLRPSSEVLEQACRRSDKPDGLLAHNLRIELACDDAALAGRTYSFEITRLEEDRLAVAFKDVSPIVLMEREAIEAEAQHARQSGRLQVLTSVLHDIGNAVTSIGTRVATMLGENGWPECSNLKQLSGLFRAEQSALEEALGPERGRALVDFADGLHGALSQRREQAHVDALSLHRAVTHVQEILAIQRSMVRDGSGLRNVEFRIEEAIHDALTMVDGSYAKRGIRIERKIPRDVPLLTGDRTRLTQLLLNVLKNAAEAYDAHAHAGEATMAIAVDPLPGELRLTFADAGVGFDANQKEHLFEVGWTTKTQGSGTGLPSCRAIAESHGGSFDLHSDGPGRGAVATLVLPLSQSGQR